MKIKIILVSLVLAILLSLGYFVYTGKITIPHKLKLTTGSANYITVEVPVNTGLLEVHIDGDNELVYTNEMNIWVYTNTTIILSQSEMKGYTYKDDIYFKGNAVFKRYGNAYVSISDKNTKLDWAIKSLEDSVITNQVYTLKEENELKALPEYNNPAIYKILDNDIVVSEYYNKSKITTADAISYITDDGYYNAYTKYLTAPDAYDELAQRLANLSKSSNLKWYTDGTIFYMECGDRYVGIRTLNYNTQIVVTAKGISNKDYVLSTLQWKE